MLTLAADAVTLDFSTAAAWFAGILATVSAAGIIAAVAFAWRAAMSLQDLAGELRGIRKDITGIIEEVDDHENRIRTVEGRPGRKTRKEAMLES